MKKQKKIYLSLWKESGLITMLFLGLLFLGKQCSSIDTENMNPLSVLSSSLEYTDLYYSQFYDYSTNKDTSIVLMNIGRGGRKEIAKTIELICANEKLNALGVDIFFPNQKDSIIDASLKTALQACSNITMAENFKNPIHQSFGKFEMGHINLLADKHGFIKFVKPISQQVPAFVFALSGQQPLSNQKKEINFWGTYKNFVSIESKDFINNPAAYDLSGKYVLLGYAGEYWGDYNSVEDKHKASLQKNLKRYIAPTSSGLEIHANALHNILYSGFVYALPNWIHYSMLATLFFLLCSLHLYRFNALSFFAILEGRIIQIVFSTIILFALFLVFHLFRWKFTNAIELLTFFLSFELVILYINIIQFLKRFFSIDSYILHKL